MNKTKLKAIFPSIVYLIIAGVFFIQTFQIRQSTSGRHGSNYPKNDSETYHITFLRFVL